MKRAFPLAAVLFLAAILHAHALVVSATPAPDGSIAGPDVTFQIRFNSRIDGLRSRLSVIFPDRSIRALAIQQQASPTVLAAEAKGLAGGKYALRWQVLSADGHITRGEFPFTVE